MSQIPKVTVCIASYNHAKYLPATLESVLSQDFSGFEVILVDDGSSDNSFEVAESYAKVDSRIRVFRHPGNANRGISATWNKIVSESQGMYLAWIGSDDLWYPEMLTAMMSMLDDHADIGLGYAYADVVDGDGNRIAGKRVGEDITLSDMPILDMICRDPVPGLTAIVRRVCIDAVGPFHEDLVCSDWEMWIRIMLRWKVGFVSRSVGAYRIHDSNISIHAPQNRGHVEIDLARMLGVMEALQSHVAEFKGDPVPPSVSAMISLQAAYFSYQLGYVEKAKICLAIAFDKDPLLFSPSPFMIAWLRGSATPWLKFERGSRALDHGFGRWMISEIESLVVHRSNPSLVDEIAGAEYVGELCKLLHDGDVARARWRVIRALIRSPRWVLGRQRRKQNLSALLGHPF
jgi:hypothetical protein